LAACCNRAATFFRFRLGRCSGRCDLRDELHDDEADAIRLANDSRSGLGATMFTRDAARGARIATERLAAGGTQTAPVAMAVLTAGVRRCNGRPA
jgi:hypothetical protein